MLIKIVANFAKSGAKLVTICELCNNWCYFSPRISLIFERIVS